MQVISDTGKLQQALADAQQQADQPKQEGNVTTPRRDLRAAPSTAPIMDQYKFTILNRTGPFVWTDTILNYIEPWVHWSSADEQREGDMQRQSAGGDGVILDAMAVDQIEKGKL